MSLPPHPFSLRQLQYAVAVADALSFRKAAERCHVSQPSLSAQLLQLEGALGTPLFERDRRRVLLTAAGRELIARAREVLRESDDLLAHARRAGDPLSGSLRVGVIPTLAPYLLPRISPAVRAAYPKLQLLWVEERTGPLIEKLQSGALEAGLLALEAEIGDVEHELIAHDPFVLAMARSHPLAASAAPANAAELRDENVFLLEDGHCFAQQALAFCSRARAHELEFRATSLSTLAQMVAGGAGVTLLPELAVATEAVRAKLHVRRFARPAPQRTLALVWRRRSPLAPALRQLAATMRAAYPAAARDRPGRVPSARGKRARDARA